MKKSIFGAALGATLSLLLASPGLASPEDNKQAAMNAMTDLFTKQDPAGVDRYFNTTMHYAQHNMHIPDGLDALRGIAQAATEWPDVHITINHGVADGDMVVLHSVYRNLLNLHKEEVAFDMFRFKDGKIIEHWDSLEPLSTTAGTGPKQFGGVVKITNRDKTEANRAIAKEYVETVLIAGKRGELSRFVDAHRLIEHAPKPRLVFDATKPDLSTPMSEAADSRYVKVHHTLAEGNFVFVRSEGQMSGEILVIADLFRLKNGKIVEHWDVRQPVAPRPQWANPNGPF